MIRCRLMLMALAGAVALGTCDNRAQAMSVEAFKINGVGAGPDGLPLPGEAPRMHWAVGLGTHLGLYCGAGTVETDSAAPEPNGTITGEFGSGSPFIFRGSNGDELVCWYGKTAHGAPTPGTFTLTIVGIMGDGSLVVTAAFVADFVPDGSASTGKFAGVSGYWTMYAYTEPFTLGSSDPVYYSWEGKGQLNFAD